MQTAGAVSVCENAHMDEFQQEARALVERIMQDLGVTATELARGAGVTPSTLTRFLNKDVKHTLSAKTVAKLRKHYAARGGSLADIEGATTRPLVHAAAFDGSTDQPTGDEPLPEMMRREREAASMSKRDLAAQLGVTAADISRFESGQARPSLQTLIDFCAIFRISGQSFLAPGSPYLSQIANDPTEIRILEGWRRLSELQKGAVMTLLETLEGRIADGQRAKQSRGTA